MVPRIVPSRGSVQSWHLRLRPLLADRQTRVFWAQVNKDSRLQSKTAAQRSASRAGGSGNNSHLGTDTQTSRQSKTEKAATANCFSSSMSHQRRRTSAARSAAKCYYERRHCVHWQDRQREGLSKFLEQSYAHVDTPTTIVSPHRTCQELLSSCIIS